MKDQNDNEISFSKITNKVTEICFEFFSPIFTMTVLGIVIVVIFVGAAIKSHLG